MEQILKSRRLELEEQWRCGLDGRQAPGVRKEVLASWARSSRWVRPEMPAAPVEDDRAVAARWAESRLGRASRVILEDLTDLAAGGDMVAAITDEAVTIAWMTGGRTMSRRAERVHFTLGGHWSESSAGTNALAVAAATGRPSTIFSAEHYARMVHDWVCYSAPVIDPHTGRFLGVIDVSAEWEKAHPTLLTTVTALARCVEYELRSLAPESGPGDPGLVLHTLGPPEVEVDGRPVAVSLRQMELLAVLSLNPEGLTLDEVTGRVYGDQPVRASTVKAELSHLRRRLGGRIGSRPYRLLGDVRADHTDLVARLTAGDVAGAVALYRGPMLVHSDSPEIETWRLRLEVAVRDAALRASLAEPLFELSDRCPYDVELHEAALRCLPAADARRSLVAGRLGAARL